MSLYEFVYLGARRFDSVDLSEILITLRKKHILSYLDEVKLTICIAVGLHKMFPLQQCSTHISDV